MSLSRQHEDNYHSGGSGNPMHIATNAVYCIIKGNRMRFCIVPFFRLESASLGKRCEKHECF